MMICALLDDNTLQSQRTSLGDRARPAHSGRWPDRSKRAFEAVGIGLLAAALLASAAMLVPVWANSLPPDEEAGLFQAVSREFMKGFRAMDSDGNGSVQMAAVAGPLRPGTA